MLRTTSNCPYCPKGVIAVDDDVPAFVFDPDGTSAEPCPHLTFAIVCLWAYRQADVDSPDCGQVEDRTGVWTWIHGEGLRKYSSREQLDPLPDYIHFVICEHEIPFSDIPRHIEREITGGNSGARESVRPGSGEFPLSGSKWQSPMVAILDGWGIYSPNPRGLVDVVREKLNTVE
jgi:hypothetical protein